MVLLVSISSGPRTSQPNFIVLEYGLKLAVPVVLSTANAAFAATNCSANTPTMRIKNFIRFSLSLRSKKRATRANMSMPKARFFRLFVGHQVQIRTHQKLRVPVAGYAHYLKRETREKFTFKATRHESREANKLDTHFDTT